MKAGPTMLRSVFVLAFASCDMQAGPDEILVLVDLDQSRSAPTDSSKLSPALAATNASGGILKAADGLGRVVIALPPNALFKLKNEPSVKAVSDHVPPDCAPVTRIKISYNPDNAPTVEELHTLGLDIVENYEKGSFLIVEPRNGTIDARLLSELERNPRIRYVVPVLHIKAVQ
jgi:hypothetical protein